MKFYYNKDPKIKKKMLVCGIFQLLVTFQRGHDALSAAAREINEEVSVSLGFNVDIKAFRYMFSYRTMQKFADDFIENQFYDFFILRQENLSIENVKMQVSEVQALKFVDVNELIEMCDKKIIVDRKPVYDELISYLHRY